MSCRACGWTSVISGWIWQLGQESCFITNCSITWTPHLCHTADLYSVPATHPRYCSKYAHSSGLLLFVFLQPAVKLQVFIGGVRTYFRAQTLTPSRPVSASNGCVVTDISLWFVTDSVQQKSANKQTPSKLVFSAQRHAETETPWLTIKVNLAGKHVQMHVQHKRTRCFFGEHRL